jgi:hypothetical protein
MVRHCSLPCSGSAKRQPKKGQRPRIFRYYRKARRPDHLRGRSRPSRKSLLIVCRRAVSIGDLRHHHHGIRSDHHCHWLSSLVLCADDERSGYHFNVSKSVILQFRADFLRQFLRRPLSVASPASAVRARDIIHRLPVRRRTRGPTAGRFHLGEHSIRCAGNVFAVYILNWLRPGAAHALPVAKARASCVWVEDWPWAKASCGKANAIAAEATIASLFCIEKLLRFWVP